MNIREALNVVFDCIIPRFFEFCDIWHKNDNEYIAILNLLYHNYLYCSIFYERG
jgi:hypothetical protein